MAARAAFNIGQPRRVAFNSQNYLDNVIEPLLERYRQDRFKVDLAFTLPIMVWHLFEWLNYESDENDLFDRLLSQEPMFDYLNATANANKHFEIKRSPRSHIGLVSPLFEPLRIDLSIGGNPQASYERLPTLRFDDDREFEIEEILVPCLDLIKTEISKLRRRPLGRPSDP